MLPAHKSKVELSERLSGSVHRDGMLLPYYSLQTLGRNTFTVYSLSGYFQEAAARIWHSLTVSGRQCDLDKKKADNLTLKCMNI